VSTCLPPGLPAPAQEPVAKPYWDGTRAGKLVIQRCNGCGAHQWGPPRGRIWSWQRPHHPVHPALNGHGPYTVVLVELPEAGNVRMVGNLLCAPDAPVEIGADVEAVFEPHDEADPPYTLVQWRVTG
jgi:uncharacterized protein